MASELILDRADAGVEEMVKDWADGQTYELHLTVRQTSSDPKSTKFEVVEAVDETADAPEEDAPEGEYSAEKPNGKAPGRMAGKPAIMIAFGPHP